MKMPMTAPTSREELLREAEGHLGFLSNLPGVHPHRIARIREALTDPAQDAGSPPEGATHLRRPEYLTAWLFDGVATMPLWLIKKYHSQALPGHRKGMYATAVDGEFWRWLDAEKFNELYVSATPSTDRATS